MACRVTYNSAHAKRGEEPEEAERKKKKQQQVTSCLVGEEGTGVNALLSIP